MSDATPTDRGIHGVAEFVMQPSSIKNGDNHRYRPTDAWTGRRGQLALAGAVIACWIAACASIEADSVRAGETPLTTVRVATLLDQPLFVTHAPDDLDRLFVVEQTGRIKIIEAGAVLPVPFLNIDPISASNGERGLLGLAFHPGYADNGFFLINYTDTAGNTVIARYRVSTDPNVADDASQVVVLTITQPDPNHNGGWIAFGPDGYLYVATGDGGAAFDTGDGHTFETGNAQDVTNNLLGKILRLDVDGDDFPEQADRTYRIPPSNPFVGLAGDDEIWAFGLRNPWRCAFDSATGDLYIADVGQQDWEEIDVQRAGAVGANNYGWRCLEASACTERSGCSCADESLVRPVHEYGHGGSPFRCSVTGGEVYRGCAIPDLQGTYFFADYCSNQIWSLRFDGNVRDLRDRTLELAPGGGLTIRTISSFGSDAAGELYICDQAGGEVFKIVPDTLPAALRVSATNPPNAAIDARQPFEPDGTHASGWRSVDFIFDGCVPLLEPGDFLLERTGGTGDAPTIEALELINGNSVRVRLSQSIDPGTRWTLTHLASGDAVTIASLPGDVNADGHTGVADMAVLIDALVGADAALPLWSIDIDRSGAGAPSDLLRLIDLFAGAGDYLAYVGLSLP